jgi:hypothetical protein
VQPYGYFMGAKTVTLIKALSRNIASLGYHPHVSETLACKRRLGTGNESSSDALSISFLGDTDQLDFASICRSVEATYDEAAAFLGDERDTVDRGREPSTQPGNVELAATIAVEARIGEEPSTLKALSRDRRQSIECSKSGGFHLDVLD